MKYLHKFESKYKMDFGYATDYREPWVGVESENHEITFNDKTAVEDYEGMPLTMKAISGRGAVYVRWDSPYTIQYSRDGGDNWSALTSATTITLQDGDEVSFKGTEDNYVYTRLDEDDDEEDAYSRFRVSCQYGDSLNPNGVDLMGNIMSMIAGDAYRTTNSVGEEAFRFMFGGSGNRVLSAKHLVLPARNLSSRCYCEMFSGSILYMPPAVLPATRLYSQSYNGMFYSTKIKEAPIISATTLASGCCSSMFSNCYWLEKGPALMAKTLTSYCYERMFSNCYELRYIKAMFTGSTFSNSELRYWTEMCYSAKENGVFVKNSASNFSTRGSNGIPNQWQIVNEVYPDAIQ